MSGACPVQRPQTVRREAGPRPAARSTTIRVRRQQSIRRPTATAARSTSSHPPPAEIRPLNSLNDSAKALRPSDNPDEMRTVEIITHAIVIGAGATAVMDLWAACLRRFWRVPSLDYALLGRWIGHFPSGRFIHESIASAVPIRHERIIGWSAHYAIGIVFAALLLLVWGPEWLERP